MKPRHRLIAAIALLAAALVVVIIVVATSAKAPDRPMLAAPETSAGSGSSSPVAGSTSEATSTKPPTRWWVSPAGQVGSTIDVENPEAAAVGLTSDKTAYCTVLKSSASSGHGIFTSASSASADVIISTKAWVAELTALAPPNMSDDWQVFGDALVRQLQGTPAASLGSPALNNAIQSILTDTQKTCGLDLSKSLSN